MNQSAVPRQAPEFAVYHATDNGWTLLGFWPAFTRRQAVADFCAENPGFRRSSINAELHRS